MFILEKLVDYLLRAMQTMKVANQPKQRMIIQRKDERQLQKLQITAKKVRWN